jgi:hypothetical protein
VAFRVVGRKLSVDFRIGQASRPCFCLELGDGLGEGDRSATRHAADQAADRLAVTRVSQRDCRLRFDGNGHVNRVHVDLLEKG